MRYALSGIAPGVPLLRAERLANAPSFAPGGTVCGLPLLLWWAVCSSMQGHTYGVSGTHACMDGMLALCPWLLSGIPSWACSPGFCSAQSFKNIEHVLSAFKKKPHGDRLTAGEDAAPPPPPTQPARVSRSVAATLQRHMSDMTAQKPCGLAACAGLDPHLFDTMRLCITVPVHNAASFCLHCFGNIRVLWLTGSGQAQHVHLGPSQPFVSAMPHTGRGEDAASKCLCVQSGLLHSRPPPYLGPRLACLGPLPTPCSPSSLHG